MANRLRQIRERLLENIGLKLIALLLAALSFYAIREATSDTVTYDLPLEVQVEKGIAVLSQDPSAVAVTFRGSREDLRDLVADSMKVVVRAKASNPGGSERIPIKHRDIQGSSGVRAAAIDPPYVSLTFDREVVKTFNVAEPKLIGKPLAGTVEVEYSPKSVRVRGPLRLLAEEEFAVVHAEPVDVEGRVASFDKKLKILYPHDWVTRIDPPEVVARVKIIQKRGAKKWDSVPVQVLHNPSQRLSAYVDPPTVSVTLNGKAEILNNISSESIRVFVDCSSLDTTGVYELPVSTFVPVRIDVEIAAVEPATVKVSMSPE